MINICRNILPLWLKLFFLQPDHVPVSNDLGIFEKPNGLSDRIQFTQYTFENLTH